jgi:hypothetical protein
MEQNYIINFANQLINNLYSDTSNNNSTYEDNITNQLIDVSSIILNSSSLSIFSPNTYRQSVFRPSMFRPINSNYLNEDTSHNNTSTSSNYLQNIIFNSTLYDSSYIALASIDNSYYNNNNNNNNYNNLNYPRAISLRDVLRTLYVNYYEEEEDNTFLETFINSTFESKTKYKKVISDSELEKLKPQKFNKINETETNSQCPILCYNFEENEEIIKLPCNHNYNCEAITKWLSQESNTCPVCRHEFEYKEINITNKQQNTDTNTDTERNINTIIENDYMDQDQEQEQEQDQEQESNTQNVETTNIYNLFSSEDILMQQILLSSYSNNNHSNNNY